MIWPGPVRNILLAFKSERFTPEETYGYIVQVILETESLLLNPVLGKVYTEEAGEYAGAGEQATIIVANENEPPASSGKDFKKVYRFARGTRYQYRKSCIRFTDR